MADIICVSRCVVLICNDELLTIIYRMQTEGSEANEDWEPWIIRYLIYFAVYAAFLLENHRENNHTFAP